MKLRSVLPTLGLALLGLLWGLLTAWIAWQAFNEPLFL